jgi:prepilin-type N-terminal cleavage/methylation domain-containing protein
MIRPTGSHNRRSPFSRGLTLLEVVIALAIFVGSIAAIGQLVATGVQSAVRSRLQTQAVFRCESKMSEVVAGITPFQSTSETPYPDDPEWTWSVSLLPGPYESLYVVNVTATHRLAGGSSATSFSLQRLVRDPQVFLDALLAEQQAATQSGTSTSTTGGGF